jgi:hypothetical protein
VHNKAKFKKSSWSKNKTKSKGVNAKDPVREPPHGHKKAYVCEWSFSPHQFSSYQYGVVIFIQSTEMKAFFF